MVSGCSLYGNHMRSSLRFYEGVFTKYGWRVSTSKLALLGGDPHFSAPLHVGRPNVVNRKGFLKRLESVLDSRWLTNDGPMVREFEQAIAKISNARHCVAVCNGTAALQLSAMALGLKGEVIVPAFTFVATAHALRWQGLRPVFADIRDPSHSIDVDEVGRVITAQSSAVVPVRMWGLPIADAALTRLADEAGLKLIFDSAHALGCGWTDGTERPYGNAEVMSFHATKFLNTFEGGAILTDDQDFAERLRLMRNFGFAGFDKVEALGINGKMSEVCAAMGLANLESLPEIVGHNKEIHLAYSEALDKLQGVSLLRPPENYRWNYQYVVALVDKDCPLSRDDLVQILMTENVLARRYFYPGVHRMEPYATESPVDRSHLPVTERVCSRVMLLPTGTAVQDTDAEAIGYLLGQAIEQADVVSGSLRKAADLMGVKPKAVLPASTSVPRHDV